jgi:hypothetical protein
MTTLQYLSEDELIRQGLEALMKALGPIETTRFLTLPHPPRMESVQRHRRWQATLDQETFFKQVFGAAGETAGNE